MSFDSMAIIASAFHLSEQASALTQLNKASACSSEEFERQIIEFEREVDKLNELLVDQFGDDPNIVQLAMELKSVVFALKADNVETVGSIS